MLRVLQVLDNLGSGGIQAFIMNVYRNIDRNAIQFDFLVHKRMYNAYEDEIENLGGLIYCLPSRSEGLLKNRRALNAFFFEHKEYSVVHMHISSLSYIEPLIAAKKNDVPCRITHSHSTKAPGSRIHTFLHYINKRRIRSFANVYLACGQMASEWFYKGTKIVDSVQIVGNGIEVQKFEYSATIRNKVRQELGFKDNDIVIGHVGRFSSVKNHSYIINILKVMISKKINAKALLVGDGENLENIIKMSEQEGVREKVVFTGRQENVNELLQAMDAFVLPSFYEGFPVVAIEAQAAGLPCFLSASITREVLLKNNVFYLDINQPPEVWCNKIIAEHNRSTSNEVLYEKKMDIVSSVQLLCDIYRGISEK